MATKYLSYEGLQKYHALLTAYIDSADNKALKHARLEEGFLKLFKDDAPAAGEIPDFDLELPHGGSDVDVITDEEIYEIFGVDPNSVDGQQGEESNP